MKDKPLNIIEHLNELRKRIIYCIIGVLIASIAAYLFIDEILLFIIEAGNIESLVFIRPTEAFFVMVKLSLLVGIIASMPFILYQVWKYVGIALRKHEIKYIVIFGPGSYLLFLCGAAFAFRGVLPLGIRFLLSFSRQYVTPLITLNAYVSFLGKMVTAFGLMFELPLVILLLSSLGIVTPKTLKRGRRHAVIAIFVLAAVLTPPDWISQIMLALPILLLYEVSIWICVAVTKKREKDHLSEIYSIKD